MFHLVNQANRERYARELEAMFALRPAIFEGRPAGGPEAAAVGAGPRDRYDDDAACYLIRIDSFGDIVCACRLRPTQGGSLIGAAYPQALAADAAPIDAPATWEYAHYYSRGESRATRQRIRAEMRLALLAAAVEAGVTRIVSMFEIDVWPVIRDSGWKVRALGPAFSYVEGAQAIAFEVSALPDDIAAFRRRLDQELQDSLEIAGQPLPSLSEIRFAGELGPGALSVVNSLAGSIAAVEQAGGVEAALALAESLLRAIRDERAG